MKSPGRQAKHGGLPLVAMPIKERGAKHRERARRGQRKIGGWPPGRERRLFTPTLARCILPGWYIRFEKPHRGLGDQRCRTAGEGDGGAGAGAGAGCRARNTCLSRADFPARIATAEAKPGGSQPGQGAGEGGRSSPLGYLAKETEDEPVAESWGFFSPPSQMTWIA